MAKSLRLRRRTAIWCAPNPCCRTLSPPTFAPQSRISVNLRDYPAIPWRQYDRADISSASPKNGPLEIHEPSPPMPETSHAGLYLAFDFGAESGRTVLAHLES